MGELMSLEIESIVYDGAKQMVPGSRSSYGSYEYASSSENKDHTDYTSLAIFLSAVGVAMVGVLVHRMNGYKKLSDDSQHPSAPVNEVMPAEMESSVSGNPGMTRSVAEHL